MNRTIQINIFVVFRGFTQIWLTMTVEKEKASEEGTTYASIAMASDSRISDAWWDYEKVDNPSPDARE